MLVRHTNLNLTQSFHMHCLSVNYTKQWLNYILCTFSNQARKLAFFFFTKSYWNSICSLITSFFSEIMIYNMSIVFLNLFYHVMKHFLRVHSLIGYMYFILQCKTCIHGGEWLSVKNTPQQKPISGRILGLYNPSAMYSDNSSNTIKWEMGVHCSLVP